MQDTEEHIQDDFTPLTDEEYFARVEEHLALNQTEPAQQALNCVKENSGRKHFLQSEIYSRKRWFNEQRKQLKAAVKAEPDNEQYKARLEELEEFRKSADYKKLKKEARQQMGYREALADACAEGLMEGCCYCLCAGICEGIGNGC